jgi:xanthine dehydrogenase accessory factor
VYEIAAQVKRWLAAGVPVNLARVVQVRGISSRDRAEAAAATAGEAMVGAVLAGAVDDQVAALLVDDGAARLVELDIGDAAAHRVGLSCGGSARLVVGAASEYPEDLWDRLIAREPVCLVTRLEGETGEAGALVGRTDVLARSDLAGADPDVATLFLSGVSQTAHLGDRVVTALWPVPTLVVVGDGAVADALAAMAGLLGWEASIVTDADAAQEQITRLAAGDGLVVLSHDRDVDGPALTAALAGQVGYIGAMGSRRTQAARADWLAERGITDLGAVHGPAGLDIGADTPAEIALAIFAEMLATRSGGTAASLRDSGEPIHRR